MSPWMWIVFPLVGAAIGWCTNWLAVKMIFRPREPMRIAGIRIQGVLPRRRSELAQNVAETVERDLLSVETIQAMVQKLVEGDEVRQMLHDRIDTLIGDQINNFGPLVRNFIPQDLVSKIKLKLEEEVVLFIEGLSAQLHGGLQENLDIREMVKTRIEGFDVARLEDIVFRIAAKELRHIEILGAILGFAVGLIEVLLMEMLT